MTSSFQPAPDDLDDVTGHLKARPTAEAEETDDVTGHLKARPTVEAEDDVEGHLRPKHG